MKLESLTLDKFKGNALKKEQMFMLNGGGTATGGGTNLCDVDSQTGQEYLCDYSYDAVRTRSDGSTYITFHGRYNFRSGPCL